MRSMWKKVILGVALMAVTAFAADNTLGTWKLDLKRSKFPAGTPAFKTFTTTRSPLSKPAYFNYKLISVGVSEVSEATGTDGSPYSWHYTAGYGGGSVGVASNPLPFYEGISIEQKDANHLKLTAQRGMLVCPGQTTVSKNGKTMTTELFCGTGPPTFELVSEKVK